MVGSEAAIAAHPSLISALDGIDQSLLDRSGAVFYSGRSAFARSSPIYFLGLNPGGDPERQASETISSSITAFYSGPAVWSDYLEASWGGARPGTFGLQPRVLHMMRRLGLDPQRVPASNVAFVRSRTESLLLDEKNALLAACWPVHQAVIDSLGVGVIVCFGGTSARITRQQLGADELVDSYRETNARGWRNYAHRSRQNKIVVTVTHPGRADWRNANADPSDLVMRALAAL